MTIYTPIDLQVLNTESYHDDNFIDTDGTAGYCYDDLLPIIMTKIKIYLHYTLIGCPDNGPKL